MSADERWLWGAAIASAIGSVINSKRKDAKKAERFYLLWLNSIGMGLYPV